MEGSFGSQQGQGWGDVSLGEGLRFDAADMSRAGTRTFVSCMPGECPKQLADMESLLGFSGEVFAGILSQQKNALQLCWQKLLGLPGCVISSLESVRCWELHHPSGVY